jgi:hypothetical protein
MVPAGSLPSISLMSALRNSTRIICFFLLHHKYHHFKTTSAMLITALRGFKVPVSILDRYLEAHGVEPTYGYPPFYYNTTWDGQSHHYHTELQDDGSKFLRAKVDAIAGSPTNTRIFVPQAEGQPRSTHAYVAYAWVMVYAQRRLDLAEELPNRAPPGFAGLRSEILGYADGGELETLQVKRLEEEGDDPTAALYVVKMYERSYPLELYSRKVSADLFSLLGWVARILEGDCVQC